MALATSTRFTLPDTMANWPWKRRMNPDQEVKDETDAWFRTINPFSTWTQKALEKGNYYLLASLAYPVARKAHLRTASDLVLLFFFFDDHMDGLSILKAQECADIVMDALKNPDKPRPEDEDIIGEIFRQFWSLGVATATPLAQKHFIKTFGDFAYSQVEEAVDRESGRIRGIEDYMILRRYTIGLYPCFPILELGMDLFEEVWNHHVIEELRRVAVDIVSLDNDMFSYKKEVEAYAADHNIITIVMHEKHTDIAGAMDWLAERRRELTDDFIALFRKVPSYTDLKLDCQVQEYVGGIANWALANYCWSLESGRYFGPESLQLQKHRVVTVNAVPK